METATNQNNARAQAKHTQVKVSVDPQVASAFKKACAAADVSMAAVLSRFMADFSDGIVKAKPVPDYSTRRKRRAAVKHIISELGRLRAAEGRLLDSAPENLQDAPIYETADQYMSIFDDVIDQLGEMVP